MPETPWYQVGPPADSWPEVPEPTDAAAIGPANREPVGIYLGSSAMETLERAIASSPERAVAGFLLGRACRGPARPFVLVTGVTVSPDPRDALDGPRFGAQALAEMERVWRREHQGEWVVGWFHGRPMRGVAFSDFDRFTHHRLFPAGWQIALVIDTERDASLLYRSEGASLVPCDHFYYWRQTDPAAHEREGAPPYPKPSRGRAQREPFAEAESAPGAGGGPAGEADHHPREAGGAGPTRPEAPLGTPRWIGGLALLLIGSFLLLVDAPGSLPWLESRVEERWELLAERNEALDRLKQERERLRRQREAASVEARSRVAAARNAELSAAVPPPPPPREFEYTIRPGDTMWAISATYVGNPLAFRDLAKQNGITNPDLIFPGQRLRLPGALPPAAADGEASGP